MLLALLIDGREFLGMQPTDTAKLWKPAILWTDPGSDEEYGERVCEHLPEGAQVDVPMFRVGRTTRADEWEALAEFLLAEGFNFVVLDNLMGIAGDTNDADATPQRAGLRASLRSPHPPDDSAWRGKCSIWRGDAALPRQSPRGLTW
ncbi:hypothetical protein [uncultured Mycobacterium sp.]|uniref:hypothetical protein n=1 Tax=uncultured Mycobacterium sp. TaxID=171292 RepID=UPI0035CA2E2D